MTPDPPSKDTLYLFLQVPQSTQIQPQFPSWQEGVHIIRIQVFPITILLRKSFHPAIPWGPPTVDLWIFLKWTDLQVWFWILVFGFGFVCLLDWGGGCIPVWEKCLEHQGKKLAYWNLELYRKGESKKRKWLFYTYGKMAKKTIHTCEDEYLSYPHDYGSFFFYPMICCVFLLVTCSPQALSLGP